MSQEITEMKITCSETRAIAKNLIARCSERNRKNHYDKYVFSSNMPKRAIFYIGTALQIMNTFIKGFLQ